MGDMRAGTAPLKVSFTLPFHYCLLEELKTINRICCKVGTIELFKQMYSTLKFTRIKE